jgi:hypothetical protein
MEVHHHPQVEKKNFKEYFLEFLMIFLAVTLGFFAESLREHVSDNSKEIEYLASIIEDLKSDSATLNNYINVSIPYHRKWIDSEINLLQLPSFTGKDKVIYQAFILGNLWTYDFFKTDRTLSQLNSEGFRLIKNMKAVSAITAWETQLGYNNITLNKTLELQADIDVSANILFDKDITSNLSTIALANRPLQGVASLSLAEIPDSAKIEKPDAAELNAYVKKLKVYDYYLISNTQQDYKFDLKVLETTLGKLEKINGG